MWIGSWVKIDFSRQFRLNFQFPSGCLIPLVWELLLLQSIFFFGQNQPYIHCGWETVIIAMFSRFRGRDETAFWSWMERGECVERALGGAELDQLQRQHTQTHTHTSSLIMSSHLSISSVELQQTVSDTAALCVSASVGVCVCGCVCACSPQHLGFFVGQGVAGQITDYCELFVCSL